MIWVLLGLLAVVVLFFFSIAMITIEMIKHWSDKRTESEGEIAYAYVKATNSYTILTNRMTGFLLILGQPAGVKLNYHWIYINAPFGIRKEA